MPLSLSRSQSSEGAAATMTIKGFRGARAGFPNVLKPVQPGMGVCSNNSLFSFTRRHYLKKQTQLSKSDSNFYLLF